jgi:hypothetical protein
MKTLLLGGGAIIIALATTTPVVAGPPRERPPISGENATAIGTIFAGGLVNCYDHRTVLLLLDLSVGRFDLVLADYTEIGEHGKLVDLATKQALEVFKILGRDAGCHRFNKMLQYYFR